MRHSKVVSASWTSPSPPCALSSFSKTNLFIFSTKSKIFAPVRFPGAWGQHQPTRRLPAAWGAREINKNRKRKLKVCKIGAWLPQDTLQELLRAVLFVNIRKHVEQGLHSQRKTRKNTQKFGLSSLGVEATKVGTVTLTVQNKQSRDVSRERDGVLSSRYRFSFITVNLCKKKLGLEV